MHSRPVPPFHPYTQVATPAQPDGEIQGQIVPPGAANFDVEATANDNIGATIVRFFADGNLIAGTQAPLRRAASGSRTAPWTTRPCAPE